MFGLSKIIIRQQNEKKLQNANEKSVEFTIPEMKNLTSKTFSTEKQEMNPEIIFLGLQYF